ncbi:MAG: hypothetical protein K5695_15280 [Oscillospiraceae bacterium]|nr:hypothetical protein [Oscillospiraceae bacterium]
MWIMGEELKVEIAYRFSDAEMRNINKQLKAVTEKILAMIPKDAPLSEIELILHDYLMTNIKYEYDYENVTTFRIYSILGPLLDKKAVCAGYSAAFKFLSDLAGLPCLTVSASAIGGKEQKKAGHAWNIVALSKASCCHVDVTWDSNCYEATQKKCYEYFNLTDDQIEKAHFWDRNEVPPCVIQGEAPVFQCKTKQELKKLILENIKKNILRFTVSGMEERFENKQQVLDYILDVLTLSIHKPISNYVIGFDPKRNEINIFFVPALDYSLFNWL